MRSFSTVLLLFLALLSVVSKVPAQEPPPPPPPAKDYSPKLWKDFTSPDGRFRARYPDSPTESSKSIGGSEGEIVLHSFSYGSDRFIYYSVSYRDLLKAPRNEAEARELLNNVR